ncbi:VCBS repeat-containing protein [uncultured Cyclobacterium sp.]|uniref:VCBS repeat-containing protein n=1 Tax=uncultured Cyclobacterium sp. TaxID=453820 RepID=UPI0030EF71C8|tara:strand:- start:48275 stop:51775 length:3501 start_codon:yes stop_codon:yes gene_type:complete
MKKSLSLLSNHCLALFLLSLISCQDSNRFTALPFSHTGIEFENTLLEDEFFNILTYEYFYNGAGVAAADFDNDGLDDLVFTSNMGNCEIYANIGDFVFENKTPRSGIVTEGKWATGIAIVDINQDGLRDIYICFSGPYGAIKRKNALYINVGDFKFIEKAAEYGLADNGFSTQAAFFDYDRDGDLDMYLLNNMTDETGPNIIRPKRMNGEMLNTDKLYQNNGDATFSDVSKASGITLEGYGLGLAIADFNDDNWPDIMVSNDYLSNDILYLNQKDGTFLNVAGKVFQHTSYSAMGNDAADYNNDGKIDLIEVDMLPPTNYRQKLMFGTTGHDRFTSEIKSGYEPQYMRNTLQLNRGINVEGLPQFSEISFLAGVFATDWSWAPLWADWDNDGWKDLFITNGYPRDITNRDFVDYRSSFHQLNSKEIFDELKELKGAHLGNFMFQNRQDLTFKEVSKDWGFGIPGYSSGMVYSDLNNDGQLDLVINNTYSKASVYKNNGQDHSKNHFLKIRLEGEKGNLQALGTKIKLYVNGQMQYYEHYLTRGYQSSVSETIHFGLGDKQQIDSIQIHWPDGQVNLLNETLSNQIITLNKKSLEKEKVKPLSNSLLSEVVEELPETLPIFYHQEKFYADFNLQPLLPHKHSQLGPGIAVADINADQMDDLFIGGAFGQSGVILSQQEDSRFASIPLSDDNSNFEDMGALFFDADSDGDQDLYVVSGGNEFEAGSGHYQDRLYLNDGQGKYERAQSALPTISASGSCVTGADFDKDGDIDLFVGGRLAPNSYPLPGTSQLLQNEGGTFTEVADQLAPGLKNIGMVTAALWTDYNEDNWVDLILVGEWMEITLFENQSGKLILKDSLPGIKASSGWWNSIIATDINQDGMTDYIVGNLGLNSRYQTSIESPLEIHCGDFDNNGNLESIISFVENGIRFPIHPRNDLFQQIPQLKKKFLTFHSYGNADLPSLLGKDLIEKTENTLSANTFSSALLINRGDKGFEHIPLPNLAQISPVFGMESGDFDGNGLMEIFLAGNFHQTEVITGSYDASYGLRMEFEADEKIRVKEQLPGLGGDVRAVASVYLSAKKGLFHIAAKNNQPTQWINLYGKKVMVPPLPEVPGAKKAMLYFNDGRLRAKEFYFGSAYLSQLSNHIFPEPNLVKVVYYDKDGTPIKEHHL